MTINLIPPSIKKEHRLQAILDQIYGAITVLLIVLAFVAVGAYLVNRTFSQKADLITTETEEVQAEIKQYVETERQIKDINTKLQKIDGIAKTRTLWSSVLIEIARSTPQDITVKDLNLDQTSKTITITGIAETRGEIARFKEKMESSSWFQNTFFSSSSINESDNNFTFSLSAELEKTQ